MLGGIDSEPVCVCVCVCLSVCLSQTGNVSKGLNGSSYTKATLGQSYAYTML